jgi:hypothetical protein
MAISDIFNYGNLTILGIVIICFGLIIMYFESKFRDQNHKISSMVSLVSSMAEELNMVRGRLQNIVMGGAHPQQSMNNVLKTNLIDVSDDEEDEEEEDEDEEDEEESEEEDDDEGEDDESEEDDEDDKNDNSVSTKVLNYSTLNLINDSDIKILNFDKDDESVEESDNDLENIANDLEEIENTEIFDTYLTNTIDISKLNEENDNNLDLLKSINISSIEEDSKNMNIVDYKKISLNKLRSIVVEKGLVTDSSKMKKPEMLKLLGIE